jgi:hypothetical protein
MLCAVKSCLKPVYRSLSRDQSYSLPYLDNNGFHAIVEFSIIKCFTLQLNIFYFLWPLAFRAESYYILEKSSID